MIYFTFKKLICNYIAGKLFLKYLELKRYFRRLLRNIFVFAKLFTRQ